MPNIIIFSAGRGLLFTNLIRRPPEWSKRHPMDAAADAVSRENIFRRNSNKTERLIP